MLFGRNRKKKERKETEFKDTHFARRNKNEKRRSIDERLDRMYRGSRPG